MKSTDKSKEVIPQPVSLSKRAFAKRHSVSERTVDNWTASGMPVLRVSRKKLLFPIPDSDQWIREKFLVAAKRKPSSRIGCEVEP